MKKTIIRMVFTVVAISALLSLSVMAAEPTVEFPTIDVSGQVTESLAEIATQVFAVIGVLMGGILTIIGGKLVYTKVIQVFKSLTSKV